MPSDSADIHLFLSNRLENLAEALIHQQSRLELGPLVTDTILVQSRGMARWLNLFIANRLGIQMNTSYLYPRALIDELLSGLFSESDPPSFLSFSSKGLFWRIYQGLPTWSSNAEALVLKRYLEAETASGKFLRRYQLAHKLAFHFEQLQLYRPDLIAHWEREKNSRDWRPFIWNSLHYDTPAIPLPALLAQGKERLKQIDQTPGSWPKSLHIFGISSLPPSFLNFLKDVSQWIPTSIYLTQPSPLYWGDLVSRKKQLKKNPDDSLYSGHELLGSFGKQGQDFLNTLIDEEIFTSEDSEKFSPPQDGNLLGKIQSDLYQINTPLTEKKESPLDESFVVKVCHSPKREIEVLKDELLRRFQNEPDLSPDEIIIMAPNIEAYSSAIQSVFGDTDRSAQDHLPYSIADHSTRTSSPVAHSILAFLDLLDSRFTANDVVNFLSIPVVSDRFGFQETEWSQIRTWIHGTAIRWGIDSNHRTEVVGTSFEEYSWDHGINQLVAGYLIHPEKESDWSPLLPYPDMEGDAINLLDRLLEAWLFIKQHHSLANATLRTSAWLQTIREVVFYLFNSTDAITDDCQLLLDLLSDLRLEIEELEVDDPITLKIIRSILEDRLSQDYQAGSFFSGSMTFCSLKPMRNIPAKFIGLIGLSENAFPRRDLKSEFTQFPDGSRPGDRSLREDDRYLFLESILAARDCLYISYTGIDSQTLEVQPASILVEELLDSLVDHYEVPGSATIRDAVVTKEPLQAFSPNNFQHSCPRSFSLQNLEAANALIGDKLDYETLGTEAISLEDESPDLAALTTFQQFYRNPCRFWLSNRIQLEFPYQESQIENSEPIESDGLSEFQWGETILAHPEILSGEHRYLLANVLPVGGLGDVALDRVSPSAQRMLEESRLAQSSDRRSIHLDIETASLRIQGTLADVGDESYIKTRFGKIRGVDFLSTWIEHLCLSATQKNDSRVTSLIGRDDRVTFTFEKHAIECLNLLGELFIEGQRTPIPFFTETAYLFAREAILPNKSRLSPIQKAEREFTKYPESGYGQPGESFEQAIQLCFPDPSVVTTGAFEEYALNVFGPAIRNQYGLVDE